MDEFHGSANESNEEKGSETREWLVKAKRAEEQLSKFLVKAAQVQQMVQENTALEAAEEVEFLQTKTIPTQEAMQELEKWRESLSDEVTSLVKELEVVEPTTQEKLDKLAEEPNAPVIEYVPSLVVFTRKLGSKGQGGNVPVSVHVEILFRQRQLQNTKGRGPSVVTRCTLQV